MCKRRVKVALWKGCGCLVHIFWWFYVDLQVVGVRTRNYPHTKPNDTCPTCSSSPLSASKGYFFTIILCINRSFLSHFVIHISHQLTSIIFTSLFIISYYHHIRLRLTVSGLNLTNLRKHGWESRVPASGIFYIFFYFIRKNTWIKYWSFW